eukprot:COSAG01_NODE_45327_length_410_cov_1.025723_2_plen_28_part_01
MVTRHKAKDVETDMPSTLRSSPSKSSAV